MKSHFRDLLFVAAVSGEGQFRQFVDPELARRLLEVGFRCHCCYLPELREEQLKECSALVLIRTPMPGHAQDDSELFRQWSPRILDAVRNGMGLAIFFSESYGRSEGTLEEFTAPLGARCCFNLIHETDPARCGMIPNLDAGTTVVADVSGIPSLSELEIVTGGGHGTQQLSCELEFPQWRILLRGGENCRSEAFPAGFYSHGSSAPIERPVFAAERQWGEGNVVLFPGSAPLWLASGFLGRFGGYLLRQRRNAGLRFLNAVFEKTARRRNGETLPPALAELDRRWEANRTFSFRYATAEEQQKLRSRHPFRIFVGTPPPGMDAETTANQARENGCTAAVIVEDYDALTPEIWRERRARYRKISGIDVLPGYEQIDDEGNASVVFSVTELPAQRHAYPNSNLLEDLLVKLSGYAAVYARTGSNRYPLWRHGGYNLVEYNGDESLTMYLEKVSSASSLGLLTVNRGVSPADEKHHTFVLAPEADSWRRYLTENHHDTFIASGSLQLLNFGLYGPKLISDDWEGYWYEWDENDTTTLELSLAAESPITEVVIRNGSECFRKFEPGTCRFDYTEELTLTADLRLTVSARCADGDELISSFPLYTRNRHFWAHTGSDQMNDYHNVFVENHSGMMGIGDRFYEPYGFVTCGFAWGDYVRITSPVPWSELMPSGIEVSSMTANFKSFHPSLFVCCEDGSGDFLNNHHRRLGFCDGARHIVLDESCGMWLEQPGAVWRGHGGRIFHPTRAIVESNLWECTGEYEIPRWKPYEPTEVKFHLKLRFKRDFTLTRGRIILAESLHLQKENLLLNGVPLEELLQNGTDVDPAWKEWDNLNAFELFRRNPASGPALPLPEDEFVLTDDPCGTWKVHLPGTLPGVRVLRAWKWRADGFMLSYEWELPLGTTFTAGTEIPLEYSIFLAASPERKEVMP